jgi:hypothetical protein
MTRNGRSSAGVKVKLVTLQSGTDDPGVVPQPSVTAFAVAEVIQRLEPRLLRPAAR